MLAALTLAGAGCTGSTSSPGPAAANTGALTVTVRYAGGPATANGGTPTHPVARAQVEVTGKGTSLSAAADSAGVVTFRLAGGRYSVHVSTCGSTGDIKATVTTAKSTSVTWICSIP